MNLLRLRSNPSMSSTTSAGKVTVTRSFGMSMIIPEAGRTITEVIEEALRENLYRNKKGKKPFRLRWVTIKGKLQPGVDLTDRDALYERMEGRK
jgi:hypothetical protein